MIGSDQQGPWRLWLDLLQKWMGGVIPTAHSWISKQHSIHLHYGCNNTQKSRFYTNLGFEVTIWLIFLCLSPHFGDVIT